MIAYVEGILKYVSEKDIIVDVGGIGYMIIVPTSVISNLPKLESLVRIYTYMAVREDAVLLYGFLERDDEQMFEKLITVNGIGPKGAIGILSTLSPDELRFAILSDDVKTISKAPGIGTKTAGRLVLELKDKIDLQEAFELRLQHGASDKVGQSAGSDVINEAVQALVVLGYSGSEALKAVKSIEADENTTVEQLLAMALKSL